MNVLNNLKSNKFFTLITANVWSQLILIIFIPILSRLYSPSEFGVFASYTAITNLCIGVASLRYEMAITIEKVKRKAIDLVLISIFISIITALLFQIGLIILNDLSIYTPFKDSKIVYLIWVPIVLVSLFNILTYYNLRDEHYQRIAKSNIGKSFYLSIFQTALGFFNLKNGLIYGHLISRIPSNRILAKQLITSIKSEYKFEIKNILSVLKEYKNFPLYSAPAVLLNTLANNLPFILIPVIFNMEALGIYMMVNKILGMPSTFLSTAVSQIFFKKTSVLFNDNKSLDRIFIKYLKYLIILSLSILFLIYLVPGRIYTLILGEEWNQIYDYLVILAPFYLIRFISSPLSSITSVVKKNQYALIIQFIYVFLLSFIFLGTIYAHLSIFSFMKYYSLFLTIFYISQIFIFYKLSQSKELIK